MVSPIKAITHAMSNPIDTASSFLGNAFSKAGPLPPDIPPPPPPAQSPSGKPGKKGMQQSFLSGVAGGAAQQGTNTGKSLLGA